MEIKKMERLWKELYFFYGRLLGPRYNVVHPVRLCRQVLRKLFHASRPKSSYSLVEVSGWNEGILKNG